MAHFLIRAALAALFLVGPPGAVALALAQDVTLKSRDGKVEFAGTLLSYDGEFYRVDTIFGPLTVDAQGVECTGPGCPDPEAYVARFSISGSARMGNGLMPALISAFARARGLEVTRRIEDDDNSTFLLSRPGGGREQAHIAVRASTTAEGFADLIAQEAELALALRAPNPMELRLAAEAGQGDLGRNGRGLVLAHDAIVPIVAPGNPISRLSLGDLERVISGRIADWSELGGPSGAIQLHLGAGDRALAAVIADLTGAELSGDAIAHTSLADLSDAVAADRSALGIATWSTIGNARPLSLRGSCGALTPADRRSIKAEDYPLPVSLMVYTPVRRLPLLARQFLDFFSSPGAEVVIRRAGFVDPGLEPISLGDQGNRLANSVAAAGQDVSLTDLQDMIATLRGAVRLSVSYRFRGGSTQLDVESFGNVSRLATALERGAFDGRELIFVGFSDSAGGATANRAISLRRAEAVRAAIRDAAETANFDRVELEVAAFGEAMPIACDDSQRGRDVNRRVEVWLR